MLIKVSKTVTYYFLTETQVQASDDTTNISDVLSEFSIIHNINTDKFCIIAYCYKNTIDHIEDSSIPSVTLVSLKKNSFCRNPINI